MRLPPITALLLALPAFSHAATAQEEDGEQDELAELIVNPLPESDLGEEDNGWLLTREDGTCRMYSFNDPLVLEANAADPSTSAMRFQMFDEAISEPDRATLPLVLSMRAAADAPADAHQVTATG